MLFFELFIYTLFTELGYHLTVHPDVPESNRHPDYMAEKDGQSMYLEAKFMDMQSQEQQSHDRREKELFNALNKVDAHNS